MAWRPGSLVMLSPTPRRPFARRRPHSRVQTRTYFKGITMTNPSFNSFDGQPSSQAPVSKVKWIVQLVVSILCFFNIVTIVLAILGLVKADTDLATANKFYKWGWIAYIIWVVVVIGIYVILFATGAFTTTFETY